MSAFVELVEEIDFELARAKQFRAEAESDKDYRQAFVQGMVAQVLGRLRRGAKAKARRYGEELPEA